MITWKKIKIAINTKLKQSFNIEVNSKDITEGFNRPSFFVEFDEPKREGSLTQVEKSTIIRIYYFPSSNDNASVEILDVQEQLGDTFDMKLHVEDRYLNINEPNFTVSDGVLQFEFDIAFEEAREAEFDGVVPTPGEPVHSIELMKELDIDIEKG